ncbi:MAG: protein kinase, partial [Deltaproteobacteria bacterium]|nr:protein kinase [Deltaproteobacteria bacterium]
MADSTYTLLGPIAPGATRASLALKRDGGPQPLPVVFVWLPSFALNEEELRTRVIRENERATVLEHPHVVRVHGLETHEGRLARVVEFSDGEPLARVLEAFDGKLPVPLAVRVVMDACSGVHYAHEAGFEDGTPMLHGDLRADTLMVTFSGTTRVGGYGALVLAPREHEGRRKVHAAPEQVLGGREAMSRETDVYLLGLVLHRCLTGCTPWEDDKDFDRAVLTEPLPALSPAEVPPALAAVLEKALSKKALGRYPTAYALRAALEQAWPKVASEAQLATALAAKIPPADPLRASRTRLIQEGLAALVPARPPPLPPPASATAAKAPAPQAPAPESMAPQRPLPPARPPLPAARPASAGADAPRSVSPAVTAFGVAFLAALGVAGWLLSREPAPPATPVQAPRAPFAPAAMPMAAAPA